LPVVPFRPERWQAMDADVRFTGDHVFRDSELPIHKVDTRIVMDNAVMLLEPLKFRYARRRRCDAAHGRPQRRSRRRSP
jgi:uncharacterized protein involved in outer membrane biogenesis